jgi:hypothetical protein
MFKIVGYRDLRPVDWVSGKRMPLEHGDGHICDRCGAEHAVVYEVEDSEAGKMYSVGSGCATKQFGFDVENSRESKSLVKRAKVQAEKDLDEAREVALNEIVQECVEHLNSLAIPRPVKDETRYSGKVCWSVGDSIALEAPGRGNLETQLVAIQGWRENRIRESVPNEMRQVPVPWRPGHRAKGLFISVVTSRVLARLR